MFDSWKYPNVPIREGKILLYKLPFQYSLMNLYTFSDTHVVHETGKTDNFRSIKSTSLCGYMVSTEIHRRQQVERMCEDCMVKLDKKLERAMYDEHNDELYLPV